MKSIFSLGFYFLVLSSGFSQSYNQIIKDSLSVSKIIELGGVAHFETIDVKFTEVITDSRCPKAVMCIRAGEAFVLVSIYKNGTHFKDQKLRFDASGFVSERNNLAFSNEDFSIFGFNLTPYPVSAEEPNFKNYMLELVYKPNMID